MKVFKVEYAHLLGPMYYTTARSEETALRKARAAAAQSVDVTVTLEPSMTTKDEALAASLVLINQPVLKRDGSRVLSGRVS